MQLYGGEDGRADISVGGLVRSHYHPSSGWSVDLPGVVTAEGRVGSNGSGDASGALLAVSLVGLTIFPFVLTTKKLREAPE